MKTCFCRPQIGYRCIQCSKERRRELARHLLEAQPWGKDFEMELKRIAEGK
jgi:hypothetical protein